MLKNFFFLIIFLSFGLEASDHIDGVPSLGRHQQVDLSDLYAFPTPGKKESLTVILNLYPGVKRRGHFSSKVSYDIFINQAQLNKENSPLLETILLKGQKLVITCHFKDHHHPNISKCSLSSNNKNITQIESKMGKTASNSMMKVFTGRRADPFFATREHFEYLTGRKSGHFPAPTEAKVSPVLPSFSGNLLEGLNVLSIIVEIDLKAINFDTNDSLIAVAAQSFTRERGHKEVLDIVGRPEITNMGLHSFGEAKQLKRSYNTLSLEKNHSQNTLNPFKARLLENIKAYDKLDSEVNWSDNKAETLANTFLKDYLILDPSMPCHSQDNNYLEIERSFLMGLSYQSCGGRHPSDDVMRSLYALFLGGAEALLGSYNTGVSKPYASSDKNLSKNFPYLATPWKNQWASRKLLMFLGKKNQEGKGR